MKLWIRSQDRTKLANIVGLEIQDSDTFRIYGTDSKEYYLLGKYLTRERALKILDEIQRKMLRSGQCIKGSQDGIRAIANHSSNWAYSSNLEIENDLIIYEMPEK